MRLKFLTDENIAPTIVNTLRKEGFDVIDVKEQKWFGKPDSELIELAKDGRRVILTHDKDFLMQIEVPVILLRFRDQRPSQVKNYLLNFLNSVTSKKISQSTRVIISEDLIEFHRLR